MTIQDELHLKSLQEKYESEAQDLREKLAKKKAKLKAAESRIRARISARERKRRTRRLILMGSYLEHVTKTDPHSLDRLMKGLDEFLERDRDRELFDYRSARKSAPVAWTWNPTWPTKPPSQAPACIPLVQARHRANSL